MGHCRPHVRLDEAGTHAVHSNPITSVGHREAFGHADDRRLAGVVRQISPASDLAGHRCQAHDDAALLLDHRRQDGLGGEENGLGVDVHDRVPVLLGNLERWCCAIDAGVIHKDVNPTKLGARLLDHGPEILAGRDVCRHYQRAMAKATHLRRGALGVLPIYLSHDDVRTHAPQLERGGAADATTGAGDDGDLSFQLHLTLLIATDRGRSRRPAHGGADVVHIMQQAGRRNTDETGHRRPWCKFLKNRRRQSCGIWKDPLEAHVRAVGLVVLQIVVLLLAGTAGAQDRDDQWSRCTAYDEHGKLRPGASSDLVIDACTAIIASGRESKELAAAFANRGYAYRNKRDYDHAIQDLGQAIKLDPNNALAFTNRGEAYANKREYDRAIQDYDQAIELEPNNARTFNDRGGAYSSKHEYDRAVQDLDQAIRLDANFALAFNDRGAAYIGKGEYDRAIQDLDQAIKLDPNLARAFYNRGIAYYDRQEYDRAIQDYDEAIRLDPKFAAAFHNRGYAYSGKREYDRAIPDYDQAIRLVPSYARAFYNRGNAYSGKHEYDRAVQDYDRAIELEPNYAYAFAARGHACSGKREYDRAIHDFDQAIRLDPNYAYAFAARGNAYSLKHEYDRAIQDYDQAIRLDPNYAPAFTGRCAGLAIVNRLQEAIADCNESLRRQPGDGGALNARGTAYLKLDQLDLALTDFDTALQADPKDAFSLYGRGIAKGLKGDQAGADADIAAAKQISSDITEDFEFLGLPAR